MATPQLLPLRRVRILEYALFGLYIGFVACRLKGDQLSALVMLASDGQLFLSPTLVGLGAALVAFPILLGLHKVIVAGLTRWQQRNLTSVERCLVMAALFFAIGISLNTDEQSTLETRMARLSAQGQHEEALETSSRYLNATPQLVALRTFALLHAKQDQDGRMLAEHFFDYPLPLNASSQLLRLDSLAPTIAPFYPRLREVQQRATPEQMRRNDQHLRLLGLLLDRRLDAFARQLPEVWPVRASVDSLPSAYREALLIYQRQSASPAFAYVDPVKEALLDDFFKARDEVRAQMPATRQKQFEANALFADHSNTYWYYYYYNSPSRP